MYQDENLTTLKGDIGLPVEILVFYLPICFFYYLAKLIIFTWSSRTPCIFSLKGDSKGIISENKLYPYVVSEIRGPPLHFIGQP